MLNALHCGFLLFKMNVGSERNTDITCTQQPLMNSFTTDAHINMAAAGLG